MQVEIDYLNMGAQAEDEFMLAEFSSGDISTLDDEFKERMTVAEAEDLDAGEWLMIVDDELIQLGTMHPFRIHAYDNSDLSEGEVGVNEAALRNFIDVADQLLRASLSPPHQKELSNAVAEMRDELDD